MLPLADDFAHRERQERARKMTTPSLIVFGVCNPRAAPALCNRFGVSEVIPGWSEGEPFPPFGALIFTSSEPAKSALPGFAGRVISFTDAMREVWHD